MVLLELHERITIPTLLNNSESWVLNKTEIDEVERIEIHALKSLFRLPLHTPDPAVIYTFGTLYTGQRIDQKQLLYLHKILTRNQEHWTQKTLQSLDTLNIGWAKRIKDTLQQYNLPNGFEEIKQTPKPEWTRKVKTAIEARNLERLRNQCYKNKEGKQTLKSKTASKSIVPTITSSNYKRRPDVTILRTSKQETKTIIMARYGQLECGVNFKGTLKEICNTCHSIDNEKHRLNTCLKWKDMNLSEFESKANYDLAYSDSLEHIRTIVSHINKVWNTRTACGTMQS